jgi:hypothetical protein
MKPILTGCVNLAEDIGKYNSQWLYLLTFIV